MNDVMLFSRLQHLGMPKQKAWAVTARIRDVLHPVAAVAAAKIIAQKKTSLGLLVGAQAQNASQTAKSVSDIGSGASLGATVGSVFPVVGTAVGAAVGAVIGAIGSLFGPAKEGQAAATWDNMVSEGYLFKNLGRGFDERYFAESMKGMMDKGNNVWPQCGKDGYKNPDCFFGPMSNVIVQGYLTKKVPLSATTAQVYSNVVVPWIQSGANGLFNWANYAAENKQNGGVQQAMVTAVVDRYLDGLPIVRSGMPEYIGQGYTVKYPLINTALASLLVTTPAKSASPSVALANAPAAKVPAPIAQAAASIAAAAPAVPTQPVAVVAISPVAGASAGGSAVITPQQDATAAILGSALSSEGVNMVSPDAQQLVADVAANGVQQTPLGPTAEFDFSDIPVWGYALAGGLLLYLVTKK
jgi:hypothetical protein